MNNQEKNHDPYLFQGTLKKIRLISDSLSFWHVPKMDEETEQHLTINHKGQVWFSGFCFMKSDEFKPRKKIFRIEPEAVQKIFDTFSVYFGGLYTQDFTTDAGHWKLELTNTENQTYQFVGPLCTSCRVNGVDLSDLVREQLEMFDLFVFDGESMEDVIDKIALQVQLDREDHSEKLVLDRQTDTLVYVREKGKALCNYLIKDGIAELLNKLSKETRFSEETGLGEETESNQYLMTIDYHFGASQTFKGIFDSKGLPKDFACLMNDVHELMQENGLGSIFDPKIYGEAQRRPSEYIICSVVFGKDKKRYYYLCGDESVEIGDHVLVPVGIEDEHAAAVKVVNVEYFDAEHLPMPLDQMKWIIRRCKTFE